MSDLCNVSFGGDYDEQNELYVETWRTARKAHTCGECKQAIPPRSRYLRVVGKSDGRMWTATLCEPCNTIWHEFSEGSWTFGTLWENFEGSWEGGLPLQPCLNRLPFVSAKEKLRDMWMAYKGIAQS